MAMSSQPARKERKRETREVMINSNAAARRAHPMKNQNFLETNPLHARKTKLAPFQSWRTGNWGGSSETQKSHITAASPPSCHSRIALLASCMQLAPSSVVTGCCIPCHCQYPPANATITTYTYTSEKLYGHHLVGQIIVAIATAIT